MTVCCCLNLPSVLAWCLFVGHSDGDDSDSERDTSEESSADSDVEIDPDEFKKGDSVRVWWPEFNQWFQGEVDKVTAKSCDVYYESEDTVATHKKDIWQIERIKNIGEEDSDDDVPLAVMKDQRRSVKD